MSYVGTFLMDKKNNTKYGFSIIKLHYNKIIEILYLDNEDTNYIQREISVLTFDFGIDIPDKYKELIKIYFDLGFNCNYYLNHADIITFKKVALKNLNEFKNQIINDIN